MLSGVTEQNGSLVEQGNGCQAVATDSAVYESAKSYWESVPATVGGMLDGFSQINSVDLSASNKFLRQFVQGPTARFKPQRIVDCGSGIGRVTKHLLLPLFETVDMVDVNQSFLDAAPQFIGPDSSRVERYICSSLHKFEPEPDRYDAMWCQWVLGQLTEVDLISFLRRCRASLREHGLIFFKENMGSRTTIEFDEKDSAWTRPRYQWLTIIGKAGLKIVREQKQPSFPKDLYDVHMFAVE